jgi:tRNA pseudouridine38-40 synthase
VASASLTHPIDAASLRRALNAMLPPDIRVLAVDEGQPGFNARCAARAKTYRYVIVNGEAISPFERRYAWHIAQPLAPGPMAEAARAVEGRHDFAAFRASGSAAATTERTIFASTLRVASGADIYWRPFSPPHGGGACSGPVLVYEVRGDGFLRYMVRTIVGTLVEIGAGRLDAGAMAEIVASGDRRAAGPTAPACGLCLVSVEFDPS